MTLSLGASCIPKESERTHGLSARPLSTYSQGPCRGSLSRGSDNTSEQGSFPRTQEIPVQASFQGTHKSPIQAPSQDLTGSLCKDPPKKMHHATTRAIQHEVMQKGLRKLQELSSRYKNVERIAGAKVKSAPRHDESDPTRTKCLKCCASKCCASKCCARHEHETSKVKKDVLR